MVFSKFRIPFLSGILFLAICLAACETGEILPVEVSPAEKIIQSSIAYHGGKLFRDSQISFSFRDKVYTVDRQNGIFIYSRTFIDSVGIHLGVMSNHGFSAKLNGIPLKLSAKDSLAQTEQINSVVYFALLPGMLADAAAIKELEGTETIGDKVYHRIRVHFEQSGGGVDYQDQFLYWIDQEDFSMDYLAYSFQVNGGGTRFRKAIHSRRVNGLLFQDYENYLGTQSVDSLQFLSEMYGKNELELLSTIDLSRLMVMPYESL